MNLIHIKIGDESHPLHFGMAALLEISQKLGAQPDNLFSALDLNSHEQRLQLVQIGLKHGARKKARSNGNQFDDKQAIYTDLFELSDLFDPRPEAFEEAIGYYYLQTYGKKMDVLIEESKKIEDEKVQAEFQNLKNAWEILTDKAKASVSADSTK